jgi:hypothetical protein
MAALRSSQSRQSSRCEEVITKADLSATNALRRTACPRARESAAEGGAQAGTRAQKIR